MSGSIKDFKVKLPERGGERERERERTEIARLCTLPARENQSNIFPLACTIVFQANVSTARGGLRVFPGVQIYVPGIYFACFEGKHRDGSIKICKRS
jgi:hypothetical protein